MPGMQKVLGRFAPYFYALLRIVAGAAFAQHGAQKLFGLLGAKQAVPLMSQFGAAGVIEFVGGILIAASGSYPAAAATVALIYVVGLVAIWFGLETKGLALRDI